MRVFKQAPRACAAKGSLPLSHNIYFITSNFTINKILPPNFMEIILQKYIYNFYTVPKDYIINESNSFILYSMNRTYMIKYRITIKNCKHKFFIIRHTHLLFMGSVPRINCLLTIVLPYKYVLYWYE